MHDREPRRLKETQGTPDALNQALLALRKGPDDAARLARVSKRLEAMLDAPHAPPPAAGELAPLPSMARPTLPLLKLLGGAVLVTPLLWLAYQRFSSEPALPTSTAPQQTEESSQPSAVALPQTQPTEVAVTPAPEHESTSTIQPRTGHASLAKGRTSRHDAERRPALAHARGAHEHASAPSAPQPSAAKLDAVQPESVVKPEPQRPKAAAEPERPAQEKPRRAQPEEAPASPAPAHVPSESELLFRARKALPSDAELALRILTEHATRYPKGQLVPEREVLAIEALRDLGRTQEADARVQAFEARYPNSLHLRRLRR